MQVSKSDEKTNAIPKSGKVRGAKLASLPLSLAGRSAVGFGRQLIGQSGSLVLQDIQEKTAEQIFQVLVIPQRRSKVPQKLK
jgi:hypothetical protein